MRPLAPIGVVAVAAGFLVVFDAGIAESLDISSFVVTLIGVLGVLQGVRYANARRTLEPKSLDLGEPERRERAAVPGTDVDEDIARAATRHFRGRNTRERVRGRVRSVAIRAVARGRNCSVDRAEALVERGEWTDDRTAAAFLSSSVQYPLRERIRGGVFGRSTYRTGVSAAIEATERVAREAGYDAGETEANDAETATTDGGSAGAAPATRDGPTERRSAD